ncbi:MAG: DUF59 domain-containing protein [Verrucomicrobia bacterium]|nr:DUF59 domain-containing protein [Verrucomicrobiota bacterium]
MNSQVGQTRLIESIKETLRQVKYLPYARDVVSFGVVKQIMVEDGIVRVELEVNSPRPEVSFQIQADAEKALRALPQLKGCEVRIEMAHTSESELPSSSRHGPNLNPLQDGLSQATGFLDPDPLIATTLRPDIAPNAGYEEDGPSSLGGPLGDRASTKWQGAIPVFQWEIDPSSPERQEYGEAEAERGGWIFRMWWQIHPDGLVYAAISALGEEEEERPLARRHPIGRNVAVNLVYDLQREGVVAIYGTALDFRPFVEVFVEGFLGQKACAKGETTAPAADIEIPIPKSGAEQSRLTSAPTNHPKENKP